LGHGDEFGCVLELICDWNVGGVLNASLILLLLFNLQLLLLLIIMLLLRLPLPIPSLSLPLLLLLLLRRSICRVGASILILIWFGDGVDLFEGEEFGFRFSSLLRLVVSAGCVVSRDGMYLPEIELILVAYHKQ
jgi:hypothetical protein